MKIWFTSDNHFSHGGILNFCPATRQANDREHMNELMITRWQNQVQPEDHVYILGDVFFCDAHKATSIIDCLPGQKHLVYGNHDKVIKSNKSLRDKFVSVSDYREIKIDGVNIILFHFPMLEWNKCHYGSYHLFGHVHGSMDSNPFTSKYRCMDVGIDSRPYDSNQEKTLYSLWEWREVHGILKDREILGHH
jgi:calcineurin-like phosphoesterase family protein